MRVSVVGLALEVHLLVCVCAFVLMHVQCMIKRETAHKPVKLPLVVL